MVDKSYSDLPSGEIQSIDVFPFNNGVPTTLQDTYNHVEDLSYHTGVRSGLELSVNTDNTKFDITTGNAIIVNREPDPLNSVIIRIAFPTTLATTDPFLTNTFTFVFLDNTGTVITRITPPSTLDDLNDLIFIGQLRHAGSVIVAVDNNPIMAHGASASHISELVFNGGIRLSGAIISPNGANLQVDITAGILEQFGRGHVVNENNPNSYPSSAQVPITGFSKAFVDGTGELILDISNNLLDPSLFNEDGLGTLETVSPANNYTTLRVFQAAGSEVVVFYYGTETFSSAANALAAVESTFVEHPDTIQISPLAKIAIKGNVTDFTAALANGDAVIQLISRRG